ncbi:hypothetical protein F1880_003553 [Penicillium rolfsii]|nr:hypothetical protein F1880_003553 [Penicillium rolfsii]
MSSLHSHPHIRSAQPSGHDTVAPDHDESKRDPKKADEIHHLYFEDNDSFFPPAWLGKDINPAERRSSNDSTTSHGPKD